MRRLAWAAGLVCGTFGALAGCSSSIGLEVTFSDDLVEAPARAVELSVFDGPTCTELLRSPASESASRPGKLKTVLDRYPLDPTDSEIFADLPTDRPLAFDAIVRDDGGLVIARSCAIITIDTLEEPAQIAMRGLPVCDTPDTALDVMIVLDTSVRMQLADQDGHHIPELLATVLDPSAVFPDTLWGIVTYGHEDRAQELLPPTSDLETVRDTLKDLEGVASGASRLFDGMSRGAELLRARAVCGRKPVLFAVVGFSDESSVRRFEDAQIGIVGARGDPSDDLFIIGVALSNEGFADLDDLVPMTVEALITGAGSRSQMNQEFRAARDKLSELRQPPAS